MDVAENEIAIAQEKYLKGEIDIEELESTLEGWLRWSKLSPLEKRKFEMEWISRGVEQSGSSRGS